MTFSAFYTTFERQIDAANAFVKSLGKLNPHVSQPKSRIGSTKKAFKKHQDASPYDASFFYLYTRGRISKPRRPHRRRRQCKNL